MIVQIDEHSPVPPYEQLRSQIATMIATGVLEVGDRLPPIRQLAADLDLANNTVARTYRELERDNWVATRGRHGTTVTKHRPSDPELDVDTELDDAAKTFAVRVAQLGVGRSDAIRAARAAINNTRPAT